MFLLSVLSVRCWSWKKLTTIKEWIKKQQQQQQQQNIFLSLLSRNLSMQVFSMYKDYF